MTFIPILKVKKVNNNYFLQDFLYLHFIVTKDTKFGKQILLFVSELLAKIYLTHNKIKLLHSEKYIDYEIFNLIRAYDNISYILYSIQQQINEQGINMYCLYLKLCDLLRKAQALTLQNIQESPEFNIHNLYELFTTLINNIEKLTNSVFYCDINVVTMNKNNNGEFRTEYSNNAIINNKIYIQCVYSSQFLQQNNINSIIKNMSICSSSCVNYVNSTRVTGLERKIKNNIVEIKDIIGVVNLENAVVIEVYLSDNKFFKYNEELVIILPKDTVNKFSFNIIYPNTHKKT